MKNTIHNQKGIGLIEVLIAAVVFALGSLALVTLQKDIFTSSSAANSRSVAMSLAQEKLEDLKGYAGLPDKYVLIASGVGGRACDTPADPADVQWNEDVPDTVALDLITPITCSAALFSRPSGTVVRNNTSYTRSWTVQNFYYDTAGTLLSEADCTTSALCGPDTSSLPNLPDQKNITVSIAWTDTDGTQQTLTDSIIINAKTTASGGTLLADTGGSGEKPTVPHTELAAPDVIPTQIKTPPPLDYDGTKAEWDALSDDEQAEAYASLGMCNVNTYSSTEAPDPDLNNNPTLDNVIVRFDSTTYQTYNPCDLDQYTNGTVDDTVTDKIKYSSSEFQTINCSCTLNTSGGSGYDQAGNVATKIQIGTKTGASNQQDELCDICCRDHHENSAPAEAVDDDFICASGATPEECYDPYRDSSGYNAAGDHKHYLLSDTSLEATSDGDEYAEVCRIKRVDGYRTVIQDWKMIAHSVMVEDELTDADEATSYQAYIGTSVNTYLKDGSTYRSTSNIAPWDATTPDVPADGTQMMSRSIYVDYMTDAEIEALDRTGSSVEIEVPFYEYKTTLLSDWTTTDGSTTDSQPSPCDPTNTTVNACTDSPSITDLVNDDTLDKGVYSYDSSVLGDIDIQSTMLDSNSGVVAEPSISPEDNITLSDAYTVSYGTTGPPPITRSLTMATTPLLTCSNTLNVGSGNTAQTLNKTSVNTSAWGTISLACSPSSGGLSSCEGYSSDQTNVTVTPTVVVTNPVNDSSVLSCSYANTDGSTTATKYCSSISALSGGSRIDLTATTTSCTVKMTIANNGSASCSLECGN